MMRMMMNFKINNKTGSPVKYEKEIHSLCDFAQQRLGFEKSPTIFLNHDKRNANNTLGKTGYYDPETMEIHVFATGRHPKDILRSIAHELVHHDQNERGEFDKGGYTGKGYAQKDPHLRKMELQANDPMLFRDWEDSLKEKENTIYNERRNRKMSFKDWKNKELSENLNKKWGFRMDLDKLSSKKQYILEEDQDRIFAPSHYCAHHVVHEGKEGFTIDHNWNEKLKKVTRYDVRFLDGTIKRNIHESKLLVLEAFTAEEHKRDDDDHPPVKKEKKELVSEDELEEGEKKNMVKGPDGKMVPDYAVDGKGEKDLTKGKKSKKKVEEMSGAGSVEGAPAKMKMRKRGSK